MTETAIVICDGPRCTTQREGNTFDPHDWIVVRDFTGKRMTSHDFCSWVCLDQFSNAKLTAPDEP